MMTVLAVFAGSLLVLQVADALTDFGRVLFGLDSTFVKVNLALLAAAGAAMERLMGATPPRLVYAIFLAVAVLDAIWAAYLGHRQARGQR